MTGNNPPTVHRTPVRMQWGGTHASLQVTLEDPTPLPTAQALRRLFPGWKSRVPALGSLTLRRAGARPRGLELGVAGGHLALYLGPPSDGIRLSVMAATTRRLLPADLHRLERGIPVLGLGSAWEDLQGLGL